MNQNKKRYLLFFVFAAYLLMLFYFTLFAEMMGRSGIHREDAYNLIPMKEIGRFVRHARMLGFAAVFLNLGGNVLAFIPFGGLVPLIWPRCRSFCLVALMSFGVSLCIETVQLAFRVGSFDVDDLILNTIGGMLGYGFFRLLTHGGK